MSEMTDDMLDRRLGRMCMPCAGYAFPTRAWGWHTADGNYIRIMDAGLEHLKNMAAKLERENRKDNDIYYPILAEIQRRKNAGQS